MKIAVLLAIAISFHSVRAAERVLVPIDLTIGTAEHYRPLGKRAGEMAVASGKLKYMYVTSGFVVDDPIAERQSAARRSVLKRHGIEVEERACAAPRDVGFAEGFNSAVNAELQRRFGNGFWEKVDREVQAELRKGIRKVGQPR